MDNFDNPEIKSLYVEIAQTDNFPGNIRLKAFKGLAKYSDPDAVKDLIQLLRNNQIQAPLLPPKKLVKKIKKTELEKIVQIFLEDELQSS